MASRANSLTLTGQSTSSQTLEEGGNTVRHSDQGMLYRLNKACKETTEKGEDLKKSRGMKKDFHKYLNDSQVHVLPCP